MLSRDKMGFFLRRRNRPIFPKEPSIKDIKQMKIGDCFLLSSLSSILKREDGAQVIRGMMQEIEIDGKPMVRVRFYNNGIPETVDITKDVRINPLNRAAGPPWVSLLEKAYVQHFYGGDYNKLDQEGGLAGAALERMLGEPSTSHEVRIYDPGNLYVLVSAFEASGKADAFVKEQFQFSDEEMAIWKKLRDDPERQEKWKGMVNKQQWQVDHKHKMVLGPPPLHVLRREDLEKLLYSDKSNMSPEEVRVVGKVLEHERDLNILPGKRGSKQYTADQLALYEQMKEQVKGGFSVVAATNEKIKGDTTPSWRDIFKFKNPFSSGEKHVKGLVSQHAYAVVGCIDEDGVKYVMVKNPWLVGYGRGYKEKKDEEGRTVRDEKGNPVLSAVATREGVFKLELNDFCKRMDTLESVGCYFTYNTDAVLGTTPNKVPAYILGRDGLYFVNKKEPITEKHLVTNNPANIQVLKDHIQLPNGTRRLNANDMEWISGTTRSFLRDEKLVAEGGSFLYIKDTDMPITSMNFEKMPAYVLTRNGLYQITREHDGDKDRTVIQTKISDPASLKWLWLKLANDYKPKMPMPDTFTALDPYREASKDKLGFIQQAIGNNKYQYEENLLSAQMTATEKEYMKRYNLNEPLIEKFAKGMDNLFINKAPGELKELFKEISPLQMQGLANLNVKVMHEPDEPKVICAKELPYHLPEIIKQGAVGAVLLSLFHLIETNNEKGPTIKVYTSTCEVQKEARMEHVVEANVPPPLPQTDPSSLARAYRERLHTITQRPDQTVSTSNTQATQPAADRPAEKQAPEPERDTPHASAFSMEAPPDSSHSKEEEVVSSTFGRVS